ncbi:MAG: hypothetical protein ACOCQN_01795 [Halanaerobiaceae bacterium]
MKTMTTFEDVFNELYSIFYQKTVQIIIRKNGMQLTSIITRVDQIKIKPAANCSDKTDHKTGMIIIQCKNKNNYVPVVSIPFKLGFNTMNAFFNNKRALVRSFDVEFCFWKLEDNKTA